MKFLPLLIGWYSRRFRLDRAGYTPAGGRDDCDPPIHARYKYCQRHRSKGKSIAGHVHVGESAAWEELLYQAIPTEAELQ